MAALRVFAPPDRRDHDSVRAAALYFVLNDLASVDKMYQFSLDAYNALFAGSIKASPRAESVQERIKLLNDYHTYAVYK
jgi:dynein heavy chain